MKASLQPVAGCVVVCLSVACALVQQHARIWRFDHRLGVAKATVLGAAGCLGQT